MRNKNVHFIYSLCLGARVRARVGGLSFRQFQDHGITGAIATSSGKVLK